jgi:hypothetical protein
MSMSEPAYMNLSNALQRVMQSGLSEPDAKREILQAIGNQTVRIRADSTRFNPRSRDDARGDAVAIIRIIRTNLSKDIDVSPFVDWSNSRSDELGFASMEVERSDVERLWPKAPSPHSPKGDERYVPPFMQLMFEAIDYFGLDGEKFVKKGELVAWFKGKQVSGSPPISPRQAEVMATLVREPRHMTGGNRKISRRAD